MGRGRLHLCQGLFRLKTLLHQNHAHRHHLHRSFQLLNLANLRAPNLAYSSVYVIVDVCAEVNKFDEFYAYFKVFDRIF